MSEIGKLSVDGKQIELPIVEGTEQERGLDISKLRATTGLVTLDEGYVNTGSTTSSITFLDGEKGVLRYRGYPIEALAKQCSFIEVSYLLIYGELPTADQLEEFCTTLRRHTMLHEDMRLFYDGFPRDAHPMAMVCATVGALSAFYHDSTDINDNAQRDLAVVRLIAKMPTIAARAYKYSIGQPHVYPDNSLCYSENFLKMCFSVPTEDYVVSPVIVDAMDKIFILHADH
ncbi:MAG: citrate (Si)-synthase, partial [Anaerolineales bacterium]|nr:citrate (Si)-synthase [Anaerolineales bacterium]